LNGVSFYDLNNGIAVGDSGIILGTTNGGANWIVSPPSGNNTNLYAVANKPGNWVAVGSEGTIIRNGNIQPSGTTVLLKDVFLTDANNGWVVGDSGIIIKTTNGGIDWTSQTSGTTNDLSSVCFIDQDIGWAVGESGVILKTTDGGTNWILQSSGVTENLNDIRFTDLNSGFAVSQAGRILKTNDGGNNWISQMPYPSVNLYDISFVDNNNGWVVGYDHGWGPGGVILRTSNSGTEWVPQSPGILNVLNSIHLIDVNNGYTAGSEGVIWHTTNGGISFVEEELIDVIPTEFLLSQNFPNPFNPSTKIKYSIPQLSSVTIKVFDILGNDIETLVNEEKPAGTYEVEFNASLLSGSVSAKGGYASGVYFYQLRADSFVDTKKMVLVK
jgi:photosystem II stability/assembly factor-like uncharacterized protein